MQVLLKIHMYFSLEFPQDTFDPWETMSISEKSSEMSRGTRWIYLIFCQNPNNSITLRLHHSFSRHPTTKQLFYDFCNFHRFPATITRLKFPLSITRNYPVMTHPYIIAVTNLWKYRLLLNHQNVQFSSIVGLEKRFMASESR